MQALLTVFTLIAGAAMVLIGLVAAVVAASSDTVLPFLPGVIFFIVGGVVVFMGILCARNLWGESRAGVQATTRRSSTQAPQVPASGKSSSEPTARGLAPSANSNAPNGVVITEAAATYLKKRLADTQAGPRQLIRLRGSPSKCAMTIGSQRDGDHVVSRNGAGVLLLDRATHKRFRGFVIDCVESPKGRKLKFRSKTTTEQGS